MRRCKCLCGGFAFVLFLAGLGYAQTPQDTGAFDAFYELLDTECLAHGEISSISSLGTQFTIPSGLYCMYYHTPGSGTYCYDFGYMDAGTSTCSTLHRLIAGLHLDDCVYETYHLSPYDGSHLPPEPGLLAEIACSDYGASLWINGAWGDWTSKPTPGPAGFHTSNASLNWDGQSHAYCYECGLESARCSCVCKNMTGIESLPYKIYMIFWDAGCPSPNPDWFDFWVALIPAKVK